MLMSHAPLLAHFLEISVSDLYGLLSCFVSVLVWLFVLLVSSIASEASNRPTY